MKLPQEVNGYEKTKHEGVDYGIVAYTKEHSDQVATHASIVTADKYRGSPDRYVVEVETYYRGGGDWDDAYVGDYETKKAAKDALVTWMENHPQGVPTEENNSQGTLSGSGMFGDPFGVGGQNGQQRNENDPFNWFM